MREIRRVGWVMVCLFAVCGGVVQGSDGTNAALKQVNKATKGLRGVVADVEYSEIVDKRSIEGSGKLYLHYAGILRVEIGGDEPRTVLFSPPFLYIHRHAAQVVELYDVRSNPHRLAQYVMLGLAPTGTALKKRFDVQLVESRVPDDKPVLNFLLTPNSKKDEAVDEAIARIQLWLDPQSGLPVRQEIIHAAGLSRLSVRYLSVTREDELPDSLFRPEWPAGVETVRK